MKRIDSHRMGFATVLFACVLCAHVTLPQVASFALVLLVLSAMTLAALEHSMAHEPLRLATAPSSDALRDVAHPACPDGGDEFAHDAELAGIEAELHTLVDQYRTEIEPAMPGWQAIAGVMGPPPR